MTTFSDRLKEAMYAQNLKQIDLVHIAAENNVKLGKSHVSQYVSGKTVPRNDILHFLADTLHVDADWLLGDSQENFTARENNSVAPKAPSTTKTSGSVGTSNSSKRGTTPMKKTITDKNDNDNAGRNATKAFLFLLGEKYKVRDIPAPVGKDINDYLCYTLGLKNRKKIESYKQFYKDENAR